MHVRRTLALFVSCAALCLCAAPQASGAPGKPAAADSGDVKAQATLKFTSGKAAFQNKRFEEALNLFRESYAMVKSPNSHLWIVYALTELGRVPESYGEAQAVSAEAEAAAAKNPKYAQTAQAARDEVGKLRARVAMLTVQVPESAGPDAKLSVAGKDVARDSWGKAMPVMPGSVEIVLTTTEGTTERKTVDVKGGGEATVSIEPPKPEGPVGPVQPPPPTEPTDEGGGLNTQTIIGIVVGSVGVAGMISFAIFGSMTSSEFDKLQDKCPDNDCAPSRDPDADDGRTYQTVANISLGVGIAGIAAGTGLIIWGLLDDGEEEPEGAPESTTPEVAVGPGSIVVHGRF